jgi:outer membrane receptor protein involved in Fe transport
MKSSTIVLKAAVSIGALAVAATGSLAAAQETVSGEIIVTATKRERPLSDTPVSASAISGEDLADANAQSLADYVTRLPGVVFNDYQPGVSEVVIRGIAATTYHEQGQTTVGYYLNEIPLVEPGFPIGIPDVDTFDLERVEVLRGPQGTLFGSSTLGGAVNYVVNTADPSGFDAAASAQIGTTKNTSGDVNYGVRAMVNAPIGDSVAVRLVGHRRFDAGYLDNIGTGVEGSNDFMSQGLRGSLVFTPGPDTEIGLLSVYQETELDDQTYFDTADPYNRTTARAEPQATQFWLNSLRLDQGLGDFATLTAIASLIDKENFTQFSYPYPYVTGVTTGDDAAYSAGNADAEIQHYEARLTSETAPVFNWLVGVSHMRAEKTSYDQIFQNGAGAFIDANPALFGGNAGSVLAPGDRIYGYRSDSVNEDTGLFGELSIKPVPQFELILGGRYFWNSYSADVLNQAGALGGYPGGFTPTDSAGSVQESEDGFTPKVTLAAYPEEDAMVYFTYSQGYRVGGINPNAGLLPTIPASYESDGVDNYELGVKTYLFDRVLYLDATAFHISWDNIQARLFGPAPSYYSYVSNAGSAEVDGLELGIAITPSRALSFTSNVTYQDAKLTSFLPDTFAVGGGYAAGSTLPGSSDWSIANNLRIGFEDKPMAPHFEIAHRYLSEAPVAFGNPNTRGNFNVFDLRAGITVGENIDLLVFANNVFDEYGILNAPFTDAALPAGTIVRPRTFGVRVDWSL